MDIEKAVGTSSDLEGQPSITAASRYSELATTREIVLMRAREAALLTIPGIMPPAGHTEAMQLHRPWQSIGAEGVNNLSAKLLLAMFPPGSSFFRFQMSDFAVEKLKQQAGAQKQNGDDARAAYEDALAKVERAVVNSMEQTGHRAIHHSAFQHLIVCGNVLLFVQKDGSEKLFALDRYCVKRDLDGNVLEVVTKESLALLELPPAVKAIVADQHKLTTDEKNQSEKSIELYTWVRRQPNGSWKVHQEVLNKTVPGTQGSYPKGKCAYIPLRWKAIEHEDYGRGRVEEYFGDHISAESLSKSIVEISAQAAKVHWLVDPSGTTDKNNVAKKPTGSVYDGNAKDVTVLMLEKMSDFRVTKETLDEVKTRLERAYLNASAVQRDAERVTAEEIRAMIAELEQGLGGVYALLAEELQRPLAARQIQVLTTAKKIPRLPEDIVQPQITTGLDGLSRQSDAQKLDALLQGVAEMFGQPAVAQYVDIGGYIKRRGAALGIDTSGIIKSPQQVQAEQAQAQQHETTQKLGPAAIKGAVDVAKNAQQQAPQQSQGEAA